MNPREVAPLKAGAFHRIFEFDGRRFLRKDDGYYRTHSELGGTYLHRAVWAKYHGPIPDDYEVHHLNGDRSDNRLENLSCMPASDHRKLHRRDRKPPRRERAEGTRRVPRRTYANKSLRISSELDEAIAARAAETGHSQNVLIEQALAAAFGVPFEPPASKPGGGWPRKGADPLPLRRPKRKPWTRREVAARSPVPEAHATQQATAPPEPVPRKKWADMDAAERAAFMAQKRGGKL